MTWSWACSPTRSCTGRAPTPTPTRPTPTGEALFTERRRDSLIFWGLAVGIPLTIGYSTLRSWGDGTPVSRGVSGLLLVGALYALVMAGFLGPIGGELKHLRVDRAGVWVRRRLLPADQIGDIRVLTEGDAAAATMGSRIDGLWLIRGVATYNHFSSHGSAVYLEQRRPDGRRRPWLLGTHHPNDLADAARRVRDAVQSHPPPTPTTTPDRDQPDG